MDFVDYVMEYTGTYPKHDPADDKYAKRTVIAIVIGIIGIISIIIFAL